MITYEKVNLFEKYQGDIDIFSRTRHFKNAKVTSEEWNLIESITQDLNLISKNLASIEYSNTFKKVFLESIDNSETRDLLVKLAEKKTTYRPVSLTNASNRKAAEVLRLIKTVISGFLLKR